MPRRRRQYCCGVVDANAGRPSLWLTDRRPQECGSSNGRINSDRYVGGSASDEPEQRAAREQRRSVPNGLRGQAIIAANAV